MDYYRNNSKRKFISFETVDNQLLSNWKKLNDFINRRNSPYAQNKLIFVASLIDYKNKPFGTNSRLYQNAMFESIQLFGKITTLPCFKDYIIDLMFTDYDEFGNMILQNDQQLTDSFATYPAWTKINKFKDTPNFNGMNGLDIKDISKHQTYATFQFVKKLYFQSFKQHCHNANIWTAYETYCMRCRDVDIFPSLVEEIRRMVVADNINKAVRPVKPDPHKFLSQKDSLLLPSNMEMDGKLNNTSSISIDMDQDRYHKVLANYDQLINTNKKNYIIHHKNDYIGYQFIQMDNILVNGEQIGEGGFANVYKGFDIEYKIGTAVKIIEKTDEAMSSRYKWLATHEIDCLRKLCHDNVIKLLGYNLNASYQERDYNCMMFVLECATNGELTHLIKQLGCIPEILSRTYFQQITQGLKACHEAFVIHRDIKCENILLDENYNIKISDFGLSTVTYISVVIVTGGDCLLGL